MIPRLVVIENSNGEWNLQTRANVPVAYGSVSNGDLRNAYEPETEPSPRDRASASGETNEKVSVT